MSDAEQQTEEIEALSSIFPSEFSHLPSEGFEWPCEPMDGVLNRIKIELQPTESDPEQIHVSVFLYAEMLKDYPTSSPLVIRLQAIKGLSASQIEELQEISDRTAAENLGMPEVFTVAVAVQEWLNENNVPGNDGSMYADMIRREQKKIVDEKKQAQRAAVKAAADSEMREAQVDPEELARLQRRQAGQAVTVESFMAWKLKFDAEMASKTIKHSGLDADESRPSGKQWFLSQQQQGADDMAEEERLINDGENEDFQLEEVLLDEDGAYNDDDDEDDEDYIDDDCGDDEEDNDR